MDSGHPFQQIDILPTTLDLLNVKTDFFAIGVSCFSRKKFPKIAYSSENLISFDQNVEPLTWNEKQNIKLSKNQNKKIRLIKAIYQQYTTSLRDNKMRP
jgi:hypothetical protein